jgi:hypothetical protein
MKRTHLLSTAAAFGLALLAAPALAQQRGGMMGGDAPSSAAMTPQNRATADVDRMHKGNGTNGGPAELLRSAQTAMRRGQTAQANELLERAETRLLLRASAAAEPAARPAQGEPAHHVSEARRALMNRDRAEAMRHTNLAIATVGDGGGGAFTGSDAGGREGAQGGGMGGNRPLGAVDSGMGALPGGGRAVVRDAGTGGISVSRAERGVVLAQSTTGSGNRGTAAPPPPSGSSRGGGTAAPPAATPPAGVGTAAPPAAAGSRGGTNALPPGDTLPGWSGTRGGTAGTPQGTPPGLPGNLSAGPSLGDNTRGGAMTSGRPNYAPGPSSSSMTGGEPARIGGAPPGDTSRAPGSSGIGGAGVGNSAVGGPIR